MLLMTLASSSFVKAYRSSYSPSSKSLAGSFGQPIRSVSSGRKTVFEEWITLYGGYCWSRQKRALNPPGTPHLILAMTSLIQRVRLVIICSDTKALCDLIPSHLYSSPDKSITIFSGLPSCT